MKLMVKPPLAYDYFETVGKTTEWLASTAKAFWSNPVFAYDVTGVPRFMAAYGEVIERAVSRVQMKPEWAIESTIIADVEYKVEIETVMDKPFGRLLRFHVKGAPAAKRKIFMAAPLSGHHATLIRKTVVSLLPHSDVYVAEWKNARNIPVSAGKFDVEDYTKYLMSYMRFLAPDLNVISICQPAPLTLAAVALLAEKDDKYQPKTMTLIGGPIDPAAAPTDVTRFSDRVSIGELESSVVYAVGSNFNGVGRLVYPGAMQLTAFMAMKWKQHINSHWNQVLRTAMGEAGDRDKHNIFYDEYLAVMDCTAEFYLTTVDRIFKKREIAAGTFSVDGKVADMSKITKTAVKTVEGGRDDISAPGQCRAALDLLTSLNDDQKVSYVEPDAGHFGIFSGSAWTHKIRPQVLDFIDTHA